MSVWWVNKCAWQISDTKYLRFSFVCTCLVGTQSENRRKCFVRQNGWVSSISFPYAICQVCLNCGNFFPFASLFIVRHIFLEGLMATQHPDKPYHRKNLFLPKQTHKWPNSFHNHSPKPSSVLLSFHYYFHIYTFFYCSPKKSECDSSSKTKGTHTHKKVTQRNSKIWNFLKNKPLVYEKNTFPPTYLIYVLSSTISYIYEQKNCIMVKTHIFAILPKLF